MTENEIVKRVLTDDYRSKNPFPVELFPEEQISPELEEEITLLKNILLYHVIPAEVYAADLSESTVATAYEGNNISIVSSGDAFVIEDATGETSNIIAADVMASNGVAHVIDRVLLPN